MYGGFLMDFEAIKKAAQGYQADMTRFLRDIIAAPARAARKRASPTALPRK